MVRPPEPPEPSPSPPRTTPFHSSRPHGPPPSNAPSTGSPGGRPTIVFHLIYTETSARFESHIADILHGVRTGDLGDLSTAQLHRVSELQCETVREENEITRELAKWQEGAVELVEAGGDGNVEEKIGGLMSVLVKADELRMRTIWRVAEMLTPQQAVEFLIAAAELQFGVRVLGLNHDNQRENV
ncbi:Protein DOG1-like 2 [Vitis vinifera]|uniref:Protein DOG1-like 2 n=1 Tax=Vitis vinifera TaxID=29760 RepID=A0A438E5H4_VITVI|nr:Protein DOG1-like 2 [Vitis vinifera]